MQESISRLSSTRLPTATSFPELVEEADELIGYFSPRAAVATLQGSLPHWRQPGVTYFVTFRSADALPRARLQQWQADLREWMSTHPEPHSPEDRLVFHRRFRLRLQTWLDSGYGACLLRNDANRRIVEASLRCFNGQRYALHDCAVAANHVHALVTPLGNYELSAILHSWKSFSANQINRREQRKDAFWQKESFDHIVRNAASFERLRAYIRAHD